LRVSTGGGLGFLAGAQSEALLRFAFHAVGIGEDEAAFVVSAGLEIQDAAGEHVGRGVVVEVAAAVARCAPADVFVLEAKYGERRAPLLVTGFAISDIDAGV